ncbi:MAG: DUF1302 family protein [Desulfobacteraceae bacterium]|nr:DUF1302 family protein [Desulfobacteraceae bacterium]
MKTIVLFCLIMSFVGATPQFAFCEEEAALEEILDGFDDEPTDIDSDLDEVLDGFDGTGDGEAAGDESGYEPILEGFEDPENASTATRTPGSMIDTSPFSIDGYVKIGSTYNYMHDAPDPGETDWRGLSKLRAELLVQAEFKPAPKWKMFVSGKGHYDAAYAINGRDEYTEDVLDAYETELEMRDTYISGSLSRNIDIKLGRQIVVWGKSDNIRITDVLNPLDFREPGLTDIEDLRLPVYMSRADYYFGDFSLTGLAIHEIRFNKLPEFGSDFFPYSALPPTEDIPESIAEHTEFAAALNGIFSGWDLSLYWADIYNDIPRLKTVPSFPMPALRRTHDRINMLGTGLTAARGNWLFKSEAAYFTGIRFLNSTDKFSRLDGLIGFEYTGFDNTTISLELADRYLLDFDKDLEDTPDDANENEFQSAIRLTRDFINDTLTLTVLANAFGIYGEKGAFQRLTLEYDLTDAFSILGGVVMYQSGDIFNQVDDNDRLIFEAKYFF